MTHANNTVQGETKMNLYQTKTDDGNNETSLEGIYPEENGTFLVLTPNRSKTYKTYKGAVACASKWGIIARWNRKNGVNK
jgi:hypothetical protein